MAENKLYRLGKDTKVHLKNGDSSLSFINQCWIMMPDGLSLLQPYDIDDYAGQIERSIIKFSGGHMLSFKKQEALEHMKQGKAVVLTNPDQSEVLGFCKVFGWNDQIGNVAGWEFGGLFVHPDIRKHHVAQYLTEQLVSHKHFNEKEKKNPPPIFAVVTVDNDASLKLFRRMGWKETHPTAEETVNFSRHIINGVNIYSNDDGSSWGKDSSIFYYEGLTI